MKCQLTQADLDEIRRKVTEPSPLTVTSGGVPYGVPPPVYGLFKKKMAPLLQKVPTPTDKVGEVYRCLCAVFGNDGLDLVALVQSERAISTVVSSLVGQRPEILVEYLESVMPRETRTQNVGFVYGDTTPTVYTGPVLYLNAPQTKDSVVEMTTKKFLLNVIRSEVNPYLKDHELYVSIGYGNIWRFAFPQFVERDVAGGKKYVCLLIQPQGDHHPLPEASSGKQPNLMGVPNQIKKLATGKYAGNVKFIRVVTALDITLLVDTFGDTTRLMSMYIGLNACGLIHDPGSRARFPFLKTDKNILFVGCDGLIYRGRMLRIVGDETACDKKENYSDGACLYDYKATDPKNVDCILSGNGCPLEKYGPSAPESKPGTVPDTVPETVPDTAPATVPVTVPAEGTIVGGGRYYAKYLKYKAKYLDLKTRVG